MENLKDILKKAEALAREAHAGQLDKAGQPYFIHVDTVSRNVGEIIQGRPDYNEDFLLKARIVGYLHDIIEDTTITSDDLQRLGVPNDCIRAIEILTKKKGVPYQQYLRGIKQDKLAKTVKLADVTHNSDATRLVQVTEEDEKRQEKYRDALVYLSSEAAWSEISMHVANFQAVNTFLANGTIDGVTTLRVVKDQHVQAVDEATYARLTGSCFTNGVIEVRVLSKLLDDAPDHARGFIGVAFRADETNERFECFYIRPTNGRCDSQQRRNSSTQYFSYPDFKFDRFRRECPGQYESYADMGLNEWIDIKIEVNGEKARLYLNGAKQPVLIVNDLKHGPDLAGGIGLWVDIGTEGHFQGLKISDE
jgi:hypothetical protein